MADHVRTQIRDKVKDLLDALTTTSTRCYAARPSSRPLHTLPALLVYTNGEDINLASGQRGARRLERPLDLVVEGYVAESGASADPDKTLDTINKEVEVALAADPTLTGLVKDLYLLRIEKEQDEEAEKPTWMIRMTFYCEYHTRETAPDAALA